ncbi:MAG: hypothetical protein EPO30_07900 [Lysobacteraceae bacterium]|nr:MAG: hypothetical protein EPO30_07900 [Xanthomonadaceae bacterium]
MDPVTVDTVTGWNFCSCCYAANNPYKFTDPDGRSIGRNLAINGGDVAQTVAGVVGDAKTVMNPNASLGERLLAGASLASEAAPISIGDVKDAAKGTKAIID